MKSLNIFGKFFLPIFLLSAVGQGLANPGGMAADIKKEFALRYKQYLENRVKTVNYIIAAKFYRPLKLAIAREQSYWRLEDGIEISDTIYQSPEWKKPRRMIIVRQEINLRPKVTGKQL